MRLKEPNLEVERLSVLCFLLHVAADDFGGGIAVDDAVVGHELVETEPFGSRRFMLDIEQCRVPPVVLEVSG